MKWIIPAIAAAALIAGGAYYVTGPLKCQTLEDDFLNNANTMVTWMTVEPAIERSGNATEGTRKLEDLYRERMQASYIALASACGEQRAGNAMRQATQRAMEQ